MERHTTLISSSSESSLSVFGRDLALNNCLSRALVSIVDDRKTFCRRDMTVSG